MASPKTELLRRDTQLAARVLWNVDGKRGVRAVAVQTLRLPDATTHFKLGGVHVIGTWDCRHRFWDVGRAAAIRVLISTYRGSILLHVWGFYCGLGPGGSPAAPRRKGACGDETRGLPLDLSADCCIFQHFVRVLVGLK